MRALAALDRIGKATDEVTVRERIRYARTQGVQIATLLAGVHFNPFVIVALAIAGGAPNTFAVEQLKGISSIVGTALAGIVATGWASFEVMSTEEFQGVRDRSKEIRASIKAKGFEGTFAPPVATPKAKVLSREAQLQSDFRTLAKEMGYRLVRVGSK